MIRTATLSSLALAMLLNASPGLAQESPTGCAAKRQALLEKIEVARKHGNTQQLAGLQEALSQVEAHCDDDSLRQKRQAKVREAREEIQQRELDLREAQAKGDPQKIARRQAKLAEARAELEQAEAELRR